MITNIENMMIQWYKGDYDVQIQLITPENKKLIEKKPGIFASKKKKQDYINKTTIFGNLQIGQVENIWIGNVTTDKNEQIIINLSDLTNSPDTTGGWYTVEARELNLHNDRINVSYNMQDMWCGINLVNKGGNLGRRLRKLGLNIKVIEDIKDCKEPSLPDIYKYD